LVQVVAVPAQQGFFKLPHHRNPLVVFFSKFCNPKMFFRSLTPAHPFWPLRVSPPKGPWGLFFHSKITLPPPPGPHSSICAIDQLALPDFGALFCPGALLFCFRPPESLRKSSLFSCRKNKAFLPSQALISLGGARFFWPRKGQENGTPPLFEAECGFFFPPSKAFINFFFFPARLSRGGGGGGGVLERNQGF